MSAVIAVPQVGLIGQSTVRRDGVAKVTGQFAYGVDVRLPGMLHAKIRRSDIPHGLLRRVDVSRALALPGVRAVITGDELPEYRASRYIRDELILAKGSVRYKGEPIAVVAADDPQIAAEAVRLIDVEYEPLPVLSDPEQAAQPGAPLIHPEWQTYWANPVLRRDGNILNHTTLLRGDVEEAFAQARHVFEDEYDTQIVHQASLEGHVAIASVDLEGRVHVVSSHQFPYGLRQDIADILHLPLGRIHVTASGLGGGFGAKLYASVEPLCVLLAERTGRPVKIELSREEELAATSPRMAARVHLRTGVDSDGHLLVRQGVIYYDAGAYSLSSPGTSAVGTLMLPGPYRWQALQIDSYSVYTNKTNCGSYRAPGGPQATFAGESQIDRIARELGFDPIEFRDRNAVENGDLGPAGQVLTGVSLRKTLQVAKERSRWPQAQDRPSRPGVRRGRGVACNWWTTTSGASAAVIKLNDDGSIVLSVGATEIGTGAVSAGLVQICAHEMGVAVESVQIVSADTDATPYDFGAQGSRTTFQNGQAIIRAARDLRQQIFALVAPGLDCETDELEVHDGHVYRRDGTGRAVPLAEVARLGQTVGGLLGRGSFTAPPTPYDPSTVKGHTYPAFNSPSFHTHVAEVEVDTETGEVTLTGYHVAQDVGFALNPLYAAGQVTGGATQGIGYALMEEVQYRDGTVLNPNFTDYKLPTIRDVPTIDVALVEEPSEAGPYGMKGVGEPAVVAPAAAIANAVYDAVGVRIRSLPITAEKVLQALRSRELEG